MAKTAGEQRDKEEQVAKNRADLLRVQYTDTRQEDAVQFIQDIITPEDIDRLQVVPVNVSANQLLIGFTLNTPQTSLDKTKDQFPEYNVVFTLISQSGFKAIYDQYYEYAHQNDPKPPTPQEVAEELADKILEVNQRISEEKELNLFDEEFSRAEQTELFNFLVQQAYLLNASDIHIEPEGNSGGARVRFRIDGRLHIVGRLQQQRYQVLLNNLQMRARIRWNADYPQTGSTQETLIDQQKQDNEVNMRIETIPTLHGSDIVIRIFNMDESFLNIDNLGLKPQQRRPVDQLISRPTASR